jgi:hypothetical protein
VSSVAPSRPAPHTLEAVLERLTYVNEETGYTEARVATGRGSDLLIARPPRSYGSSRHRSSSRHTTDRRLHRLHRADCGIGLSRARYPAALRVNGPRGGAARLGADRLTWRLPSTHSRSQRLTQTYDLRSQRCWSATRPTVWQLCATGSIRDVAPYRIVVRSLPAIDCHAVTERAVLVAPRGTTTSAHRRRRRRVDSRWRPHLPVVTAQLRRHPREAPPAPGLSSATRRNAIIPITHLA